MKFYYVEFDGEHLPIIPVLLKGRNEWVGFNTFIDTGATYSLFPLDVAEVLGVDINTSKSCSVTLGDGKQIEVYLHETKVSIANKEFCARIGFTPELGINFREFCKKQFV